MAEEFAFEKGLGQGGDVDRDETPVATARQGMDSPGDQLLARARFAGDQYGGVHRGDLDDALHDLDHRVGLADDARGPAQPLALDRPGSHQHDLFRVGGGEEGGGGPGGVGLRIRVPGHGHGEDGQPQA